MFDRPAKLLNRGNNVAVQCQRDSQQVHRFGHASQILLRLEERQRLAMQLKTFCRPPDVDQPVAEAIEAARPAAPVVSGPTRRQGPLEPVPCLLVVPAGPQ